MSIAGVTRTPCGAFIRTPCGVLADNSIFKKSLSDSIVLSELAALPTVILSSSEDQSDRVDKPYGTQFGSINNTFGSNQQFFKEYAGLSSGIPQFNRRRLGFSFPLASSYPKGASTIFELHIFLGGSFNTLESLIPQVYNSNTDDSSLYGGYPKSVWTWESNLNNLLGNLTYGITTRQVINIPYSVVSPRLGTHLSIIIGANVDFNTSGVTTGVNPGDLAGGLIDNSFGKSPALHYY